MKENLLDRIGNNPLKSIVLLFLISLFFFIGLGNVHLFDWDEINFAESAREMIASGDYLRVQINFEPFWEKPPLFFWMQVVCFKVFGINEFAARFPNALIGLAYLITFYLIGKKHYTGKFGLIWSFIFFASLLPHVYFKSGIIDPVFNYFIFLSVYFIFRVFQDPSNAMKFTLLSGIFSGLSVLTKGPVGFLLLALTVFFYLLFNKFKPFPSLKSILVFFAGFVVMISIWLSMEVYHNGFKILQQFIDYQIELFNSPVAGHSQPFYYHFVVVFLGCFPISILALPQFKFQKLNSTTDLRRWFLILFWVVIILFSLSTTKIIHYSSMTYAPLSFLATLTLIHLEQNRYRWMNVLYLIIGVLIGIAITALPIIIYNKDLLYPYINDPFAVESLKHAVAWNGFEFLIGIILIVGVIVSFYYLKKNRITNFILTTSASLAVTLLFVIYLILPKIEGFTQGPDIAFLQSISDEDCYVESYGFKSYAPYYYAKVPVGLTSDSKNQDWLLNGAIDKPVYLVAKITNSELDEHPNFKKIKREGGFQFYKREVPNK